MIDTYIKVQVLHWCLISWGFLSEVLLLMATRNPAPPGPISAQRKSVTAAQLVSQPIHWSIYWSPAGGNGWKPGHAGLELLSWMLGGLFFLVFQHPSSDLKTWNVWWIDLVFCMSKSEGLMNKIWWIFIQIHQNIMNIRMQKSQTSPFSAGVFGGESKFRRLRRRRKWGWTHSPKMISFLSAYLGGGFNHFLFSPLLGEIIQFD